MENVLKLLLLYFSVFSNLIAPPSHFLPQFLYYAKVLHIELIVKGSELLFKPPFSELDAIVQRLIITIVESGQKLPRVEHVLFPDLEGKR